ncbi:phosphoglycerate mutase [Cystoisospora suis]|uniref:Serine/threonine-protein phosphatase PGAM5, mitochondrial n=1 Tax=Cystoisospora suis TaxID=483139 RepID=A0A2C6L039_9APIC|nr:phosphoglycerate mutase [Cystoisospora suis]
MSRSSSLSCFSLSSFTLLSPAFRRPAAAALVMKHRRRMGRPPAAADVPVSGHPPSLRHLPSLVCDNKVGANHIYVNPLRGTRWFRTLIPSMSTSSLLLSARLESNCLLRSVVGARSFSGALVRRHILDKRSLTVEICARTLSSGPFVSLLPQESNVHAGLTPHRTVGRFPDRRTAATCRRCQTEAPPLYGLTRGPGRKGAVVTRGDCRPRCSFAIPRIHGGGCFFFATSVDGRQTLVTWPPERKTTPSTVAAASYGRSTVVSGQTNSDEPPNKMLSSAHTADPVDKEETVSRSGVRAAPDKPESSRPPRPGRSNLLVYAALLIFSGAAVGWSAYEALVRESAVLLGSAWNFDWDGPWLAEAAEREAQLAAQGVQTHAPAAVKAAAAGALSRPPTRQVLLVRHGQYANVASKVDEEQGLTDLGKTQAAITGRRLKELLKNQHVVAVWHSGMKRARETAEIIHKEAFADIPLIEDPILAEGVPAEPVPPSRTFKPSLEEVLAGRERIENAFRRYIYRALSPPAPSASCATGSPAAFAGQVETEAGKSLTTENPVGNDSYIILVCHGNVIRYMVMRALQLPGCAWLRWATYNAGITWISIDAKGYVSCREFGNVGHLPTNMITYH